MVLARKIAYNVILNSFLKVFSTVVLSLFSIRLITGYLGQDGFGRYATVLAFFAFFSAVADLGLGSVTAREISREGADEQYILGNVVSLRLFSSVGLFVLSPLIIFFFGYPIEVKIGIFIAAGAVVFSSLSLVLNGIFQKNLAMDKVAMTELLGKLIQVSLVALIVKEGWGFLAITATIFIALGFNVLIVFFWSRRYSSFRLRFDTAYWKQFLRESFPMGVTALITFAYFKTDTILLSVMQTSADVGIYNVAYKIIENLTFFPAMLAGLILPLLSRFIYTDRKRFESIADNTFKVFLVLVVPLVVGAWFLAPDIVRIISGDGFLESVPVLRVLIFSLGFIFFGHYFNMLLIVGNKQKKLMQTLIFAAFFNIGMNVFLIERFSYLGAAFASVLTEMLVVILTATLTVRYIRYVPTLSFAGKVFISGGLMGSALFFLEPYSFLISGVVGVGVYLLFLWMTHAVSAKEVANLFTGKTESSGAIENDVFVA